MVRKDSMSEACGRLMDEIESKIDYFRQEYEMTYCEVIGSLESVKLHLWFEAEEESE